MKVGYARVSTKDHTGAKHASPVGFGVCFFRLLPLSSDYIGSQTHCEATHHEGDLRSSDSRENLRWVRGRLSWPVSVGNPRFLWASNPATTPAHDPGWRARFGAVCHPDASSIHSRIFSCPRCSQGPSASACVGPF